MPARPRSPLSLPPIDAQPTRSRRAPETDAQRERRLQRLAVQLAEREERARLELAAFTGALPRHRHGQVRRLEDIPDPVRRLEVQKARVERMEALLSKLNRKREMRAQIVLGGALFAEARDAESNALMQSFREILERRVERPQDRLAILEAFGIPLQPVRPEAGEARPPLPDFDALLQSEPLGVTVRGARVHPDYAGLRGRAGDPASSPKPAGDQRRAARPKE